MSGLEQDAQHPNHLLARDLWTAAADGDADAMRDLLSEDVVWETVGKNPLSGVRHGPEEVFDYLARVGEAADDLTSSLESIFVNEEGAVVVYHVDAKRGARTLEMDYFLLLHIRTARITSALMVPVDQAVNDAFWT